MTENIGRPAAENVRYQAMVRIAWMYYEDGFTQAEIGERLGLSRVTVNRMLKEAREVGIVEIKVHSELAATMPLTSQLRQCFQLQDATITPLAVEGEELAQTLAKAAASVLALRLAPEITIGVGIGRTLSYLPEYLHPVQPVACRFTSLTGGLYTRVTGASHNFDVLNRLASLTGGESHYIPAPTYVSEVATREAIIQDGSIQASLDVARKSQVAIFSIGAADYSALLFNSGLVSEQDLADLRSSQAVGDVLGRFYDLSGEELDIPLNHRIIGLNIEELKQIPTRIAVAGGAMKRRALLALLQHGTANILVTDAETARWLVESV